MNEPQESPARKPRGGWWSSFLPSIRAELLAALTWIPFVALLVGLPWIARTLDRAGLPGGAIAFGAVLVVGALAAFSAPRLLRWPSAVLFRRRASGLGLAPITGDEVDVDALPFAFFGSDRSELDFANVLIEPVRERMLLADRAGLLPINFESQEFNQAFRVWTTDRRCASAVVDERMMAWLLDAKPRYGLEVSDRYLMVFLPERRDVDLAERLDLLFRARGHLSRAASSLYPSAASCDSPWP